MEPGLTNQRGRLVIEGLEKKGLIKLYKPGYAFREVAYDLGPRGHGRLRVYLESLQLILDDVVVEDSSSYLQQLGMKKVENGAIYASRKTELVRLDDRGLDLGANQARQIFAKVTGLNIYEGSDGGLQLNVGGRGLDPNRSSNFNVRQNGYDISADVLGYPESYYTPPAEALEQIEVVKGAASLQYGTQFGGLMQFRLHQPPAKDGMELKLAQSLGSFGRLSTFASAGLKKGPWSMRGIVNYRGGQGWRDNSAYQSGFAFLDIHYQINDEQEIGIEYTHFNYLAQQAGGLTDAQFYQDPRWSNRTRNWFDVNWQLLTIHHRWSPSPMTEWNSQIFGLNARRQAVGFRGLPQTFNVNPILAIDEQDPDGSFIHPRDLMDNRFRNWGLETKVLHRYRLEGLETPWVYLIGAKLYLADNTAIQGPGSNGTDADFSLYSEQFPDYAAQSEFRFPNHNLALFGEHIFHLGQHWSITPGARMEYINTGSFGNYINVNFDNAGNVIFKDTLDDNRQFERGFVLLGLGLSHHLDEDKELYFNLSQNYRSVTFSDIRTISPSFIVDPNISDEEGFSADLGFKHQSQHWSLDLSYFNLFYNNRIGLILNNRAQRVRKNIGNAWIYGVESFVAYADETQFGQYALEYQVYSNIALTHSSYLDIETSNISGNLVEFIPLYNIKTGASLTIDNWQFELQYTHIAEQFTDAENSETPDAGDLREGLVGPIPAYQLLDFFLNYQYKKYRIGLSLNNLGNQVYFTRRATGYPGPGIIPSDPFNFSFNFSWEL